jgi:catechol 2,3-dioxygenase-like lactoylglutathione lyase family enzyme
MSILGVQSLRFGVEDMQVCTRFWLDFGLRQTRSEPIGVTFETAEGTTVELQPTSSPLLPPSPAALASTVREVVWGVEKAADLELIAAALADLPSLRREADFVRATDPSGYALAFTLARRRPLPDPVDEYNAVRQSRRRGRRALIYDRAQPQTMSHVVFFAPRFDETLRFYTERLGFHVMDSYPGRSIFLRAPGAIEHHNLFLLHDGDRVGFHHVAFEVRSIHEVFGGGLHMGDQGWRTLMGPGRHPVSSAYFWYFVNPCGGAAEYDWDSDVVSEDWQAREWPTLNTTFAEWLVTDGVKRFQGFGSINQLRHGIAAAEGEVVATLDERARAASRTPSEGN